MSCNVALSLSDRAYNSYDSSLCRLSTFSPGNSHFKNESSLNETTQLIIPLTRVFLCDPCLVIVTVVIVFSISSLAFLLREAGMWRHKVSYCVLTTLCDPKCIFCLLELLHLLLLLYRFLLALELRHIMEQLPHVLRILSRVWNK